MRVIVAGVGYRYLRDHSIGVEVADRLAAADLGDDIVVEDLSYNPIAVVQRLQDEPAERRFDRAIVMGAIERLGRRPGTVTAYRWDGVLPCDEEIQRTVTEAVTGVISLDNTLVVGRHFGGWPSDVVVVEVEPAVHEFGESFSLVVEAIVPALCALVVRLARDEATVAGLLRAPLGAAAVPGMVVA